LSPSAFVLGLSIPVILLAADNRCRKDFRTRKQGLFLYFKQTPAEKAKLLRIVCSVAAVSVYPTYRKPFKLIFQRAKKEESRAQRDSNSLLLFRSTSVSLVAPPEHFGEGAVQLLLDFVWKGRGLSFAVQFNRFPGGIYNEAAVLTMLEMTHELLRQGRVQFAIQVFRNLPNYLFASHGFILV